MGQGLNSETAPTLDEVVHSIEDSLDDVLTKARRVRSLGITPELLDELLALRFRKLRLERRLESLLGGGLLSLSVRRTECPIAIVERTLAEIEPECARLGIALRTSLGSARALLRIDGNQLEEALRGILEDLVAGAEPGGEITVSATQNPDESVEIRLGRDGEPSSPSLCSSGVAFLLAGDPGSGFGLMRAFRAAEFQLTVRRPPEEAAGQTARYWTFPAPAA